MSEEKPLTGVKKRQQIKDTRKQVFIWVALASAIVVTCMSIGWNLVKRIRYQTKVNKSLATASKDIKADVDNIDSLIKNVNSLKANEALNLGNLKVGNDSTVFQTVIDALPTEGDDMSFKTSLQDKILSVQGITIDRVSADDTVSNGSSSKTSTSSSSTASFPKAQTIAFTVSVYGNYDSVVKLLDQIERTIRPIIINKMTVEGSDQRLTLTLKLVTYYSPLVDFKVGEKEVKYETK